MVVAGDGGDIVRWLRVAGTRTRAGMPVYVYVPVRTNWYGHIGNTMYQVWSSIAIWL